MFVCTVIGRITGRPRWFDLGLGIDILSPTCRHTFVQARPLHYNPSRPSFTRKTPTTSLLE
jgi:hypothetical protein